MSQPALGATVPRDLLASVVVFLVALPLCMGIAIASGLPPAAGLISGIVGGLVVGLLAGAPLLVSGPAAGLSVLVWEIIQQHGIEALAPIIIAAGLLQVAFGLLRIGPWFRAMSPAVVHAMLAGIGVLIVASQVHVMVGDAPRSNGLANLTALPVAVWHGFWPVSGSVSHLAGAIGLLSIAAMVLWTRTAGKRFTSVPPALIAVLAGSLAAEVFDLPIPYVVVPDNLFAGVTWPTWHGLVADFNTPMIMTAVAMAAIASAETLLSAVAVDQMHHGPKADFNRELIAQGAGNVVCGFLGGLPITGVIVRSSANIHAGAETRLSAIAHSLWLLAFVMLLPAVLQQIPVASLAAILVVTGIKLVNPTVFRQLASHGRSHAVIYLATVAGIVATSLLEGILLGFGLTALFLAYDLTSLAIGADHHGDGRQVVVQVAGHATFLRLPQMAAVLESLPAGRDVRLDTDGLEYLDHTSFDLLVNWEHQYVAAGGTVDMGWDRLLWLYRHAPISERERTRLLVPSAAH